MRILVVAVSLLAANLVYAQETDKGEFLLCTINKSESLLIYQEPQQVIYSAFLKKQIPLQLERFQVYKCPLCYSFSGTAEGKHYKGTTRGRMGRGGWSATLDLEINGQKENAVPCTLSHQD